MHDFSSEAFGRDVKIHELSYWSLIDLQTLSGELKARLKEINLKISRDEERGVYNKRLINARMYLQCYRNKAIEELNNHSQDSQLAKAKQELTGLKRQLKDQEDKYRQLKIFMFNLQRAFVRRFGKEAVETVAAEARGLTPIA